MARDPLRFTLHAQPYASPQSLAAWCSMRWRTARAALLASAGSAEDERAARARLIHALRHLVHG